MNPSAEVVALVRGEFARRLRGLKRSIYAGAVGAVFLTAAFVFLLIAIFLYLAEAYGAPAAALIMAAGLLVIGVIALVIASIKTRKRDLSADIQTIAAEQMEQAQQYAPSRLDLSTLIKIMGVAFAVGLVAGRKK
ncbi:MAG TPA: phage holin family protein [Kofleriaceae bacterium]|nr:phage holin family protein [Kofleriaceae bacterium]